jgi:CheY-like chemotaxis protein
MNKLKPPSILIADKEKDARDLIRETILSLDSKTIVIDADNGTKAEFKTANQLFDLAIVSLAMPGRGGPQLLKAFHQMGEKTRPRSVIILTEGKFDESYRLLFEPLFHIAKPFETDALKVIIQAALRAAKRGQAPS